MLITKFKDNNTSSCASKLTRVILFNRYAIYINVYKFYWQKVPRISIRVSNFGKACRQNEKIKKALHIG